MIVNQMILNKTWNSAVATLVIEMALLVPLALWRHPLCPGPSQATTLAGTKAIYLVAVATATILPLACPRVLAETQHESS